MILPGVVASALVPPAVTPVPTVVGAGALTMLASVASITPPLPSGLQAGDLLLACVLARADITAPAGWTLVRRVLTWGNVYSQRLGIYRRTYTSGDGAPTFTTPTAAAVLHAVTLAVRGPGLSVTVAGTAVATSHQIPAAACGAAGALFVAVSSCTHEAGSGDTTYTAPAVWTQVTPTSADELRMGVVWRRETGAASVGGDAWTHSATTHYEAGATLVLAST